MSRVKVEGNRIWLMDQNGLSMSVAGAGERSLRCMFAVSATFENQDEIQAMMDSMIPRNDRVL